MSKGRKKFIENILGLDSCFNTMLSADVDPLDFFPEGKTPYDSQVMSLNQTKLFLADPELRLMIKTIPTAGGKSPDAAATTKAWTEAGGIAVIVCPNKELQNQYQNDFGEKELSIVMGGVEFDCVSYPGRKCGDNVPRRKCNERKLSGELDEDTIMACESACPYRNNQVIAAQERYNRPLCFTPHSLDAFRKHPVLKRFLPKGNGLLIVDEAHLLEDQLRDFLSITIELRIIDTVFDHDEELGGFIEEFFLDKDPEPNDEGLPICRVGTHHVIYLEAMIKKLEEKVTLLDRGIKAQDYDLLSHHFPYLDIKNYDDFPDHLEELTKIVERLKFIIKTTGETRWVAEVTVQKSTGEDEEKMDKKLSIGADGKISRELPKKILFRPTVIPRSYLKSFFYGFSKVILMSGSFFPIHLKLLGLAKKDDQDPFKNSYLFQTESRIDLVRRSIVIDSVNGCNVNFRNLPQSFEKFLNVIIPDISKRLPGEKGIVHVSSYKQAELFATLGNEISERYAREHNLPYLPATFIYPQSGRGWKETFRRFKNTEPGRYTNLYLVAPRRYEGIDLKDDLARICVMAKMPYPNTKDTMIKALEAEFPGYTSTVTLVSFIQGMNRAVRHPGDWAINICFDTLARSLIQQYSEIMPKYVKEANVPPPSIDWILHWKNPDEAAWQERRKKRRIGEMDQKLSAHEV